MCLSFNHLSQAASAECADGTHPTSDRDDAREVTKKERVPRRNPLARRGLIAPAYLSSKPGILSQPPVFAGGKTLSRYFFFFLPAFFFILVLSFDLDLVAERFALFTGIDTSLQSLLPDKHPKPSG
jgi:hypothetical protein